MTNTERELRELLWLHHQCSGKSLSNIYGDDGEMQCSNCGGDFLRQSLQRLAENIDNPNVGNFFKDKL